MARTSKYRGLCVTCRNDPTCTFPREPSAPVTRCEEFAAGAPDVPAAGESESSACPQSAGSSESAARQSGLCENCANLPTCTFPLAGKGVLYCEQHECDGAAAGEIWVRERGTAASMPSRRREALAAAPHGR